MRGRPPTLAAGHDSRLSKWGGEPRKRDGIPPSRLGVRTGCDARSGAGEARVERTAAMLLWEALEKPQRNAKEASPGEAEPSRVVRLPYDTRCVAVTKSGRRCRGKSRDGKDYCIFHDPEVAAKRQAAMAKGRRNRKSPIPPPGWVFAQTQGSLRSWACDGSVVSRGPTRHCHTGDGACVVSAF